MTHPESDLREKCAIEDMLNARVPLNKILTARHPARGALQLIYEVELRSPEPRAKKVSGMANLNRNAP